MSLLVVGSVALDTVETPSGQMVEALGGSATYFSLAASLYTPVQLVAVVGEDFPEAGRRIFGQRPIDLRGLEVRPGRTFRWVGRYGEDPNVAETLETELNVFAEFDPRIPEDFRESSLVFLANIDPELQLRVRSAVASPRLTAMDTMNFWITSKHAELGEVMRAADIVFMNDAELRQYARSRNLNEAARQVLERGPRAVVVKRGEYGCGLYTRDGYFVAPGYPLDDVCDPTGAGDSFAGAFLGHLAETGDFSESGLRHAILHGCVVASFTVEAFGVERLTALTRPEVDRRLRRLRSFIDLNPGSGEGA